MLEKLELKDVDYAILKNYCIDNNIDFISTPYDVSSVDLLESIDIQQYKVSSSDLVDLVLLEHIALTKKPVMLSTGMANLSEIKDALEIFSDYGHGDLLLMHCVSNYPCSDKSLNLFAIKKLQSCFNVPVGFSDHSAGFQASALAVALGAKVIEKHFTFDKNLPGPDQSTSLNPDEFLCLTKVIRQTELMLGVSEKKCQLEEKNMAAISRKSIALSRDLSAGDIIMRDDLVMMRPGIGILSKEIQKVVGMKLKKNFKKNKILSWDDFLS
jgi:N,N'-diacetyllegionaminate synthase